MPNDMGSGRGSEPWLDMNAFLYAVLMPLGLWAGAVIGISLSGTPGIACLTPVAWTLAFWSAVEYVSRAGRPPVGRALWGPALSGLVLGIGLGVLFVWSMHAVMAHEARPDEIAKGRVVTLVVVIAGLVVCPLLSTAGAWIMQRRLAKGR